MLHISIFMFLLHMMMTITFFLPVYLLHKDLTATEIGLLLGIGSLVAMFAQPIIGFTSDKLKTIKKVLLWVIILCFMSGFAFFSVDSSKLIFVFLLVLFFFLFPLSPLSDSLAIKFAYENNRNYGSIRLWGAFGKGVAALLFGFIFERMGILSLSYIFSISLLLVFLVAFLLKDSPPAKMKVTKGSLKLLFTKPMFLWFLLIILFISIPHRMNDNLLSVYLIELGATETQVGLAWTIGTLSSVPMFALIGVILHRFHELLILITASLLYAIRWGIYGIVEDIQLLIYFQFLHGFTFPLFFLASIQFINKIVPEELRATGQATFAAVFGGLGAIIGSSGGGWLMDTYSYHLTYWVGSLYAIVGGIAVVCTYIYIKRKSISE